MRAAPNFFACTRCPTKRSWSRSVASVVLAALVLAGCTVTEGSAPDNLPRHRGPNKFEAVEPPVCAKPPLQAICNFLNNEGTYHLLEPEEHNQQRIHVTPSGRLSYDVTITYPDNDAPRVSNYYRFDFAGYGWREIRRGDPLLLKYTTVGADIWQAADDHRGEPHLTATLRLIQRRGTVRVVARLTTVKPLVDPDTQQPL